MATEQISDASGNSTVLLMQVKTALDDVPEYRGMLFPFGFFIASVCLDVETQKFPFYGLWNEVFVGDFRLLVHPEQKLYTFSDGTSTHFLLGHAYDPFEGVSEEQDILAGLALKHRSGDSAYVSGVNQLTGIFVLGVIDGSRIQVLCDAMGMQTLYFGHHKGHLMLASHSALVGELGMLEQSDYVKRLTSYRFFHLFGRTLPADISPYNGFRRLLPNHRLTIRDRTEVLERIFPLSPIGTVDSLEDYDDVIGRTTRILQDSMALCAQKWNRPAISLTGGCDSQTTLACASGHYDKFRYFSYLSTPEEAVDVEAAASICESLGLAHEVLKVPVEEVAARADFEIVGKILEVNHGCIGPSKTNEVAKRIILRESDIDVEIKSWASEAARAYFHKRFGKEHFQKRPKARYLTTLYKVFAQNRKLVRETDQIFQTYLDEYCSDGVLDLMDWWDLIYWECNGGAGNGFAITGVHRVAFQIEIPYNNRLLLQALLTTPVQDRIADIPQSRIRDLANPAVNALGISVKNVKHTPARAMAERMYYEVHSRIPF